MSAALVETYRKAEEALAAEAARLLRPLVGSSARFRLTAQFNGSSVSIKIEPAVNPAPIKT